MMTLGYNMAGCEEAFKAHLLDTLKVAQKRKQPFMYLEVGIAEGTTITAVANLISNLGATWKIMGLDIAGGPFFNAQTFMTACYPLPVSITHRKPWDDGLGISVNLDGRAGLTALRSAISGLDFVLIDGCHGAHCVRQDFVAVESLVNAGGIVAFHDAGLREQGTHPQSHCNGEGIGVRKALNDLGLIDSGLTGWTHVQTVEGDESKQGHGMAFFRKLAVTYEKRTDINRQ